MAYSLLETRFEERERKHRSLSSFHAFLARALRNLRLAAAVFAGEEALGHPALLEFFPVVAVAPDVDGGEDGGAHRARVGLVAAGHLKGGAVVGRGANDGQAGDDGVVLRMPGMPSYPIERQLETGRECVKLRPEIVVFLALPALGNGIDDIGGVAEHLDLGALPAYGLEPLDHGQQFHPVVGRAGEAAGQFLADLAAAEHHALAARAAIVYSLFSCCKAAGIDTRTWLEDVLRRLPSEKNIEQLLPSNWKPLPATTR